MKLKSLFITGACALACGSLQALDAAAPPHAQMLHPQQNFTELAGIEVLNFQNEKLGRIKFITADLANARLVEVIISSGGFFGIGGKLTSAPPTAFTLDTSRQVMRLNVTKARFDAAPRFMTSNVAAYSNAARVAAASRYYGVQPWFHSDDQVSGKNARISHLGHVERTDIIMGMSIKNTNGKYLGRVSSLMMDLPKGQIYQVVDDTNAMAGNGRYILQARALRYNAANNGLVLNESFAKLKGEPHLRWVGENREYFQEETAARSQVRAR